MKTKKDNAIFFIGLRILGIIVIIAGIIYLFSSGEENINKTEGENISENFTICQNLSTIVENITIYDSYNEYPCWSDEVINKTIIPYNQTIFTGRKDKLYEEYKGWKETETMYRECEIKLVAKEKWENQTIKSVTYREQCKCFGRYIYTFEKEKTICLDNPEEAKE